MVKGRKVRQPNAPPEDRTWYVMINSVAIVAQLETKIDRLRETLQRRDHVIKSLKGQLRKERQDRTDNQKGQP
jgi:hypothetical protein